MDNTTIELVFPAFDRKPKNAIVEARLEFMNKSD